MFLARSLILCVCLCVVSKLVSLDSSLEYGHHHAPAGAAAF